jgi:hypothetical protein
MSQLSSSLYGSYIRLLSVDIYTTGGPLWYKCVGNVQEEHYKITYGYLWLYVQVVGLNTV